MEDYFSYDVTLIMNITDIDDKIILRARHAHLVAQFRAKNPLITDGLVAELEGAWDEFVAGKFGGVSWDVVTKEMQGQLVEGADAKKMMHYKTALKAKELLNTAPKGNASNELVDAFEDILALSLDAKFGAAVTDQKIFRDLAAFWEADFLKDMQALNVRPVSLMTRVTEFVPEVVRFVEQIIENGYAYVAEGSVYFDVAAFSSSADEGGKHLYAKLCPWSAGNCKLFEEGEGSLGMKLAGKRDPRDFALWKASKAGEPFWESPWGSGRPGWHIECSAMAAAVAPGTLDIHSGGIDLAFPHHDNELAQSEAYYCSDQWVNYFIHAGHVHIEGHKMSKSLKNFISIREALERYSARQLRIMFLQHQWCAPVYYKESSMTTAMAVETLFSNFAATVSAILRSTKVGEAPPCGVAREELSLLDLLSLIQNKVHAALCDNFDTPTVLILLQELINRTNVYLQEQQQPNAYVIRMISNFVDKILRVFGLFGDGLDSSHEGRQDCGRAQDTWQVVGPIVEVASEFRDGVREAVLKAKTSTAAFDGKELLVLCDAVRGKLTDLGIQFEDRPGRATLVKLVDQAAVAKAKLEQAAKEADKLARRLEMARINDAKAAAKREKAAIEPATMFRDNAAYSQWDERGIPTHDSKGDELGKNMCKKVLKEYEAQVELHEKFLNGQL